MPAPAELLGQLLGRVRVLLRDQARQHLDDRHLGAEALEDRGELAADDPAAEHDEPARHLALGEQPGRVDAERRVEAFDRRTQRVRAGGDDRALEGDVLPALDRDRVRVLEAPGALDPLDAVRLEQAGDALVIWLTTAAFHSLAAAKSSWGSSTSTPSLAKLSSASFRKNAVCTQALVGMQPTRRQVPPSSGSCSMQTVLAPSWAARIAAV